MSNVYEQIDDLEADAMYWEARARTFLDLLKEARNLLVATKTQGVLPISELGTIDEEISF